LESTFPEMTLLLVPGRMAAFCGTTLALAWVVTGGSEIEPL
jgi:hypothetical protein